MRAELPHKVNGSAMYSIDTQVPGMLYGAVLRAMEQTNYSGYVGVEYVWIDWEHCNEVESKGSE